MQKIIVIPRADLTESADDKAQVTYNGVPPDERKQESLIAVLKTLTEEV